MHPTPGLPPLPPQFPLLGHPQHEVQFYSDDDMLVDGIETFLRRAVENGDGAICVATQKHLLALGVRLKARDQGMAAAAEQGRYLSIDVADVLAAVMSEGNLDDARASEFFGNALTKTTAATGQENSRVAVFGETVAVLWAEGKVDNVLRLERLWKPGPGQSCFGALCLSHTSFPSSQDAEYFRAVCEQHSTVIPPDGYPVIAGGEQPARAISLDQLVAQERRLFENNAALSYPEWQIAYRAALLETSVTRLFKRVEVAQAAVLTRLHGLQGQTDHHAERHQLLQAWRVLQAIKKEKLGFFE